MKPTSITLRLRLKSNDVRVKKKSEIVNNYKEERSKKLLTMLKYQKVKVNKIKKDNSSYDHEYLRRRVGQEKLDETPRLDLKKFLQTNLAKLNKC